METLLSENSILPVPLSELEVGQTGIITRIENTDVVSERLTDLGFLPGTFVRLTRRAPTGDPLCFDIRGSQMCIRRKEACRIWAKRK